jgi:hypothetical protein
VKACYLSYAQETQDINKDKDKNKMLRTSPENLIREPGIDPVEDVQKAVREMEISLLRWSELPIHGEATRAIGFWAGDKFLVPMADHTYLISDEGHLKVALYELYGDSVVVLGNGSKEVKVSDRGIVIHRDEVDDHSYWTMKNIPEFYRKGSK